MTTLHFGPAPSLADIEGLAREAFTSIPGFLRQQCKDLVIRVQDFPDEETEEEMGLESPFDLLGLYHGVSMNRKSVAHPGQEVDMVFLYRRPILDYWCEGDDDLSAVVRHVLIHEIGHHFGFSDDDMDALEASAGQD
jgi:predicted Zn-dependent protease with MMP-like domain